MKKLEELVRTMEKNMETIVTTFNTYEKFENLEETSDLDVLKARNEAYKSWHTRMLAAKATFNSEFTAEIVNSAEIGVVFDKMIGEFNASLTKLGKE